MILHLKNYLYYSYCKINFYLIKALLKNYQSVEFIHNTDGDHYHKVKIYEKNSKVFLEIDDDESENKTDDESIRTTRCCK